MKSKFFVLKLKDLIFVATATIVSVLIIIFSLSFIANADDDTGPGKLAIIIDDLGMARAGINTLMSIDRKLTCAVMPMLTFSEKDMNDAAEAGHEVIIHIPLQYSKNDNINWVGKHAVKTSFTDEEIEDSMEAFIENLPKAVGANIHMGSIGSTDERVMTDIMQILHKNGLYFIDSRTNRKTVCRQVSKNVGIPFNDNDIFLENKGKTKEAIKKRLIQAAKTAKKNGEAIAIGHVGAESPYTAQVIKENIEEIEKMGVIFVHASELLK